MALMMIHQYQQKDTLVKPYHSQIVFTIILFKDDHSQNYIQFINLPVNVVVEHIQSAAVVD